MYIKLRQFVTINTYCYSSVAVSCTGMGGFRYTEIGRMIGRDQRNVWRREGDVEGKAN
ncbi:hypothetical protein J4447_00960 [Candidatus Pacearchaeota archaeon]|nr:hypothetical protein [Candidatus Pacearchaeota archaeon]